MDSYESMKSFYKGLQKALEEYDKRMRPLSGHNISKALQNDNINKLRPITGSSMADAYTNTQSSLWLHQIAQRYDLSPSTLKTIQNSIIMSKYLSDKTPPSLALNIDYDSWTKRSLSTKKFLEGYIIKQGNQRIYLGTNWAIVNNPLYKNYSINSIIALHNSCFSSGNANEKTVAMEAQSLFWLQHAISSSIYEQDINNNIELIKILPELIKKGDVEESDISAIVDSFEKSFQDNQKLVEQNIEIEKSQSSLIIAGYSDEIEGLFEVEKRVSNIIDVSNFGKLTDLKRLFVDFSAIGLGSYNIEKCENGKTIFLARKAIEPELTLLTFCENYQRNSDAISGYREACNKSGPKGKGWGERYIQCLFSTHFLAVYNGSGVHREVDTGTGRIDILVTPEHGDQYIVELKRITSDSDKSDIPGLNQLKEYMRLEKIRIGYLLHIDEGRASIEHGPVTAIDDDGIRVKVFTIFSNPIPPSEMH